MISENSRPANGLFVLYLSAWAFCLFGASSRSFTRGASPEMRWMDRAPDSACATRSAYPSRHT